mmetsp:Transcript_8043/g.17164  ORF Transcript_8043/g.17164 Transcript_8043/m.17164 type:complete len:140 (-) Transcript_8043:86-505(-)
MFELLQHVHLVQTKQQLLDMSHGNVALVPQTANDSVETFGGATNPGGIYSHSVDPLQTYPKAFTFTFHNADQDLIPSITTTSSISPYGLPYGKTTLEDSTWPFPLRTDDTWTHWRSGANDVNSYECILGAGECDANLPA